MQPLQIFRAGRHIAADGSVVEFTAEDIAATVAAYDPALHRAPLVVGHPKTDDPAYGWVDRLEAAQPIMLAHPADVEPQFAELVNAKRYPNKSASFYRPDAPTNPKPGVWYLKHVGFLGAAAPAVKGLKPAQFADDADGVVLFTDLPTTDVTPAEAGIQPQPETPMPEDTRDAQFAEREAAIAARETQFAEREAALAAREAEIRAAAEAARVREITAFVEAQVAAGRVLPRHQAPLVALIAAQPIDSEMTFAEGETEVKSAPADWLRKFIGELPVQVDYTERAPGTGTAPTLSDKEVADAAASFREAQAAKGITISVAQAVDAVRAGKHKE